MAEFCSAALSIKPEKANKKILKKKKKKWQSSHKPSVWYMPSPNKNQETLPLGRNLQIKVVGLSLIP